MRALATLIVLLATIAAAGLERRAPGPEAASLTMTVRLERLSADRWSLGYRLSRPVDALDFGSPAGDLRTRAWSPEAGFELIVDDGAEFLRRSDGAPFDQAGLQLVTYDVVIPKQYVPFNTFSDGGVSVCTAFLMAEVRAGGMSFEAETSFELVPRSGEAVIADGTRLLGAAVQVASVGTPAFVYFGEAEPIESDALIAIVDPSTPDWVRGRFEAFLPRVFSYLGERFGKPLRRRPTVLVSARFDDGNSGYSIKGGVLDGQIQIRLRGEQVRARDSGVDDYLFKFIAHEGTHLWQGAGRFDNATAWIHEGGADAIALRAVEELEVWPQQKVERAVAAAVDQCARRLRAGVTLATAHEDGAFDAFYSCGLVIAAASEVLVRRADPEADLFTLWRRLVDQAERAGEGFTTAEYFAALAALGVAPEMARPLEDFVVRPPTEPGGVIETLLSPAAPRP